MIFINKSNEPVELKEWKKLNPELGYKDLDAPTKGALQIALMSEQGYVCCFCGIYIGVVKQDGTVIPADIGKRPHFEGARVAHITPQSEDNERTVDYNNLCMSCPSQQLKPISQHFHCDKAQGNRTLPIHPLMNDCCSYFIFSSDGKIHPRHTINTDQHAKAKSTIEILNLNANRLVVKRKQAIEGALEAINASNFDDVVKNLIEIRNGRHAEFYYVILSYLNHDGFC